MLVKPGVLLSAGMGVGISRKQLSAMGIQIVRPVHWSKKALVLRNQPYTAVYPTIGQMETRIHFGEMAKAHKGEKGFYNGLPVVAGKLQEEMRGFRATHTLPKEAYTRGTIHNVEQLKKMLAEKVRA